MDLFQFQIRMEVKFRNWNLKDILMYSEWLKTWQLSVSQTSYLVIQKIRFLCSIYLIERLLRRFRLSQYTVVCKVRKKLGVLLRYTFNKKYSPVAEEIMLQKREPHTCPPLLKRVPVMANIHP